MTVTTTTLTNIYLGDGVTTVFPFTFDCQVATDILVRVNNATIVPPAYAVQINDNNTGGNVTVFTPPPSMQQVFLERVLPVTQLTPLSTEGTIPAQTLEDMIDRCIMIDQQLDLQATLSLSIPAQLAGIVSTVQLDHCGTRKSRGNRCDEIVGRGRV